LLSSWYKVVEVHRTFPFAFSLGCVYRKKRRRSSQPFRLLSAEQTLTPDPRPTDTGIIFADHQKRNLQRNREFIVQYTVLFELAVPASLLLAMHEKGRE